LKKFSRNKIVLFELRCQNIEYYIGDDGNARRNILAWGRRRNNVYALNKVC
jgi:hypothetical protein